jgi:hypothetical protein
MFIPWLILQFIASVTKLLRLAFNSMDRDRTCTSNQVSNMREPDTASTAIEHSRSFTRHSSALRKSGAASASSVTSDQRVAFNEHSNGSVRTENYYYDPHAQPGEAVSATVSNTPEKTMMRTPDQRWKMNRIQTPPPPRQVMILPRRIPVSESEPAQKEKENASNWPANNNDLLLSGAAGGGLHKPPTAGRVITTARRLSKSDMFANSLVEYRPPLDISSFSEQVRKRRLRGDDLLGFVQNKRQNHGRVALGALRQRNVVLSSRATLSKRQREQRILKDMNRKRVKANPPIKPTTALNSSSEVTTTTQPTAQSTPSTAQAGATGKPQETSVPNGGFNFGSGDTSAAPTNVTTSFSIANSSTPVPVAAGAGAPADAPTPAFSFGNTPVAAQANSASSTPAGAAAAADTLKPDAVAAPPSLAYSFGSAAPPSDAPNAQTFGSTALNPVPPTGTSSFAATPAFGAATPLQPSTSGASARRRTKAKQGRRR